MRTIPNIPHGQSVPYKIWMTVTDILADYIAAAQLWIESGRPNHGQAYDCFLRCESEYSAMADNIWFAKLTNDQRTEWSRIWGNGNG